MYHATLELVPLTFKVTSKLSDFSACHRACHWSDAKAIDNDLFLGEAVYNILTSGHGYDGSQAYNANAAYSIYSQYHA